MRGCGSKQFSPHVVPNDSLNVTYTLLHFLAKHSIATDFCFLSISRMTDMNISNTVPSDAEIHFPIDPSAVQAGIQGLCLQPKTVTLKTEEVDFHYYNPEVNLLDRRSDAPWFFVEKQYGLVRDTDLLTHLHDEMRMDIPLVHLPLYDDICARIEDKVHACSTKELVLVDAPGFDRRDRMLDGSAYIEMVFPVARPSKGWQPSHSPEF